ncbi:MAG: acyl-CoA dehydrogenase, partial [Proteobacteria bacterium]|nr:acyl-CoA dehydrogenase [Pseudomonadota bacterium]
MDFGIDAAMRERLEEARHIGRTEVRQVGLEADRLGRPIPVDHQYFKDCVARGEGRTRWPGPKGRKPEDRKGGPPMNAVIVLLLAEEYSYWDRGVMVANPGPNLPEGNVLAMGTEEQK